MPTDSYEITANAKINLFLRVNGTLPNGYHRLYTVMQEIDCADKLTISVNSDRRGFKINCFGRSDIDPEKNLCKKACDRFYSNLKKLKGEGFIPPYTEIDLIKNIPSESGMGGGSSDAAAVLVVLQEHFGQPFSEDELLRIAVNVGADVPFFLYGGTCLCERVGEDIRDLYPLSDIPLLIVKPYEGVSTPECFHAIDSKPLPVFDEDRYEAFIAGINSDEKDALSRFLEGRDLLTNDLEIPSEEKVPLIRKVRESLLGTGARYSRMTGSGSAVFAMYESVEARDKAYGQIKDDPEFENCDIFLSKTI